MVGLSGLLVKSAQQMVKVTMDFKASGLDLPILVGGAALTESFTAVKIATEYDGPVLYCKDVMSGLATANQLINVETREDWLIEHRKKQTELRAIANAPKSTEPEALLPRIVYDHSQIQAKASQFDPTIVTAGFDEIWPYINQQMLYSGHLGVKGSISKILEKETDQHKKVVESVEKIRTQIAREKLMTAKAVYQFFKVRADGNDLVILDQDGQTERQRFNFLRQAGRRQQCLTDFIKPGEIDEVCFFVLTCGNEVAEKASQLLADGNYFDSHCFSAIALEMAEGFAEMIHQRIRSEWQIPDPENMSVQDLYKLKYTGLRVSFGYPACPNLDDQGKLWTLLNPTDAIGVDLSDEFMMSPEASVSALVFHHPQAKYFKIKEEA